MELLVGVYKGTELTDDGDEGTPSICMLPLHFAFSILHSTFCYLQLDECLLLVAGGSDDPILVDPRFQLLQQLNGFGRRYQKV